MTPSINLVGIDTYSIATKVENTLKSTPSQTRDIRYKKNRHFFWK